MKIVIRADGHKRIGMGHLYRMLTLARHLRKVKKAHIEFVTRNNKPALKLIESFNFIVHPIAFNLSCKDEIHTMSRFLADCRPDVLCIDLLNRCENRAYMSLMRMKSKAILVAFSDKHNKMDIHADLIFNASIFQRSEYYRQKNNQSYFIGLDFVILPEKYTRIRQTPTISRIPNKVLICMGGSDHHNLIFRVIKAIDKSQYPFSIDVVVSSSFFSRDRMDPFVRSMSHPTRVIYDPDGLADIMTQSDIAITAGGTILIERLCAGLPGITISQLHHQAALAAEISHLGAGLDLGMHSEFKREKLTSQFDYLFSNPMLREKMSSIGRKLVDGKGLYRIADSIWRKANRQIGSHHQL